MNAEGVKEEDYEYSIASQLAYNHYYNNLNNGKTQELLNNYMEGYTIDTQLSNDMGIVVKRPDGTAIVAYRGTDPTNIYDLTADALIALGYNKEQGIAIPGSRFDRAEQLYKSANEKYPFVSLTGHSLGGTLSDYVGRKYGENAVVFNPGVSPVEITAERKPKSLTRIYTTDTFDLVSQISNLYGDEVEHLIVKQTDPTRSFLRIAFSLANFLPNQSMLPLGLKETIIPNVPVVNPLLPAKERNKIQDQQLQAYKESLCLTSSGRISHFVKSQQLKLQKKLI
jgi:hypothetical protein